MMDLSTELSGRTFTPNEHAKLKELHRLKKAFEHSKGSNRRDEKRAALYRFLDENKDLWQSVEGMAAHVQAGIILWCFSDAIGWDLPAKQCAQMREDLGYNESPAIERVMIDYIACCWLRLMAAERESTDKFPKTIRELEYMNKRLDAVQRRYTRAVESLARVRKLTRATKPQTTEQPQFEGRRLEAVK